MTRRRWTGGSPAAVALDYTGTRQPLAPATGVFRLVRGSAVAAVCTLISVVGHAAAGGAVPSVWPMLGLGGVTAAVLIRLADRQPSFPALLVTLASIQTVMHVLLETLCRYCLSSYAGVGVSVVAQLQMLAVHATATVLTAWLFYNVDRALFGVAAVLGRLLPRRPALVPSPRPGRVLLISPAPHAAVVEVLFHRIHLRRGPPVRS